jgi:integrase
MANLTALQVKNAAPGVHLDGKGLHLRVRPSGSKSWVLRVQHLGRRQDIGLGSTDFLTLAEAREKAAHLRKIARLGGDAIAERDKDKNKKVIPTFARAVEAAFKELGRGWSDKTAAQFKSSLEQHANPVLGRHRVDVIATEHVIAALSPIWTEKPQMARKVRNRITQVLSFAKSHGWRRDSPPPPEEVRRGLAKQPRSKGFAAVPYCEVPALIAGELAKEQTSARLALIFTILTAARSGEVRRARWEQIDREARTWSRPAHAMKAGKPHTVMLNDAALAVLDRAAALGGGTGLVFPSPQSSTPLSDMSLAKILRLAKRPETVHGFRSSFRDWAAERMPSLPSIVAEAALAHRLGDDTVEAYLRSELRSLRAELMSAWGAFVAPVLAASTKGQPSARADIVKSASGGEP